MSAEREAVDIRKVADGSCSGLRKYAMLVTGKPSLAGLIRYEMVMKCFSGIFGGCGIFLRRLFYRSLLGGMGCNVVIGRHVVIRGPARIIMGNNVLIDDNCVLDARGENSEIKIGDGVVISRNTIIRARNALVSVGDGADIGCNCLLGTDSKLSVGREVLIGAYSYLCAGGRHRFDGPETSVISHGLEPGVGISVEDGAWIGARVTVLDGVTVGKGAVIGAHSLITKSMPAMSVSYGVPASVRRQRASK